MKDSEKVYENKLARNKAFIRFREMSAEDFTKLKICNSRYYEDQYILNFVPIGVIDQDYPLSAKLFFGNRPFSIHKDVKSFTASTECGAYLGFTQQPNAMVSILLHYPYVDDNPPFNGLDIGLVDPRRLLKKSYQKRLYRILVTSMENYSFASNASFVDKCMMKWYETRYRQIKDGIGMERTLSSHIWAIVKWTTCAIVGGYIAGCEASTFPTKITDSQFERYDSIIVQSKEELSSIKQELLNKTNELNLQLDSINQTIIENNGAALEEIRKIKYQVPAK